MPSITVGSSPVQLQGSAASGWTLQNTGPGNLYVDNNASVRATSGNYSVAPGVSVPIAAGAVLYGVSDTSCTVQLVAGIASNTATVNEVTGNVTATIAPGSTIGVSGAVAITTDAPIEAEISAPVTIESGTVNVAATTSPTRASVFTSRNVPALGPATGYYTEIDLSPLSQSVTIDWVGGGSSPALSMLGVLVVGMIVAGTTVKSLYYAISDVHQTEIVLPFAPDKLYVSFWAAQSNSASTSPATLTFTETTLPQSERFSFGPPPGINGYPLSDTIGYTPGPSSTGTTDAVLQYTAGEVHFNVSTAGAAPTAGNYYLGLYRPIGNPITNPVVVGIESYLAEIKITAVANTTYYDGVLTVPPGILYAHMAPGGASNNPGVSAFSLGNGRAY